MYTKKYRVISECINKRFPCRKVTKKSDYVETSKNVIGLYCVCSRASRLYLTSSPGNEKELSSTQNWERKTNEESTSREMKTERGVSIDNPNESWLESKGTWFTYVLLITLGHLVILSVPFFKTSTAWTLTNMFHNMVSWRFICCVHFVLHLSLVYSGI